MYACVSMYVCVYMYVYVCMNVHMLCGCANSRCQCLPTNWNRLFVNIHVSTYVHKLYCTVCACAISTHESSTFHCIHTYIHTYIHMDLPPRSPVPELGIRIYIFWLVPFVKRLRCPSLLKKRKKCMYEHHADAPWCIQKLKSCVAHDFDFWMHRKCVRI